MVAEKREWQNVAENTLFADFLAFNFPALFPQMK